MKAEIIKPDPNSPIWEDSPKQLESIVIDGVEITPEIIAMLKDWERPTSIDMSAPERFIKSLSKIQDFITRQLDMYSDEPEAMIEISQYLTSLIYIKDSMTEIVPIWEGDQL